MGVFICPTVGLAVAILARLEHSPPGDFEASIDGWGQVVDNTFNLLGGTLATGAVADVSVLDPGYAWTVDRKNMLSKSRNTPFDGWELRGRAALTIVGGAVAWDAESSRKAAT